MCALVLPALRKQTASEMVTPFTNASSVDEYAKLLASGTDPNQVHDDGSNAFFSCCCEFGQNDNLAYYRSVIRLLLDHGADLNRVDLYGQTALQKSKSDAFSVAMLEARPERLLGTYAAVSRVRGQQHGSNFAEVVPILPQKYREGGGFTARFLTP